MPASIIYNSSIIASIENSAATLLTDGKQLTDNVVVTDMFSGYSINDVALGIPFTGVVSGSHTYITSHAFNRCSVITGAIFPDASEIRQYGFYECTALTEVSFPSCTSIYASAFQSCRSLPTANFPLCTSINSYAFASCSYLSIASFPKCTYISNNAFKNCYRLISLYLTGVTSVPSTASNAAPAVIFDSTPIGGYSDVAGRYGSIFVPASLLTAFKTHSAWSWASARIVGV